MSQMIKYLIKCFSSLTLEVVKHFNRHIKHYSVSKACYSVAIAQLNFFEP